MPYIPKSFRLYQQHDGTPLQARQPKLHQGSFFVPSYLPSSSKTTSYTPSFDHDLHLISKPYIPRTTTTFNPRNYTTYPYLLLTLLIVIFISYPTIIVNVVSYPDLVFIQPKLSLLILNFILYFNHLISCYYSNFYLWSYYLFKLDQSYIPFCDSTIILRSLMLIS